MKLSKILVMSVMLTGLLVTSCGSSKNTAGTQQSNVMPKMEESLNRAQKAALANPDLRCYGSGSDFDPAMARLYAESDADNAYQRTIENAVKNASEKYTGGYQQNGVKDYAGKNQGMIISATAGIVRNLVTIEMVSYLKANGETEIWVCREYRGDRKTLANDIAKSIDQNVPDDVRMKINYDYKKFSEAVEEELAKMK